MRRLVLAILVATFATATVPAHAEPDPPPSVGRPFAVAINTPLVWRWSLAASAWLGVEDHHALRGNFARYRGPLLETLPASLYAENDFEEGEARPDFGHTTDLSLGWVDFPRRVLDGATFEADVLCRLNRLRDRIDEHNVATEERHTNEYGVRVLVGWTWRLSDWWFISTTIGGSLAYERGREKAFVGYDFVDGMNVEHTRTGPVSRPDTSLEAYLRVGMAFGQ
jgi:hypothetical protein